MSKNGEYKITIEEKDIADAIRGDSSHCMISDTIRRLYPDLKRISTDLQTIRFTKDDKRYVFLTPPVAQEKLLDFDQGQTIGPWSFTLRRPAQITKTKGREGAGRNAVPRKTVQLDGQHAPIVLGGEAPPLGALAAGATHRQKTAETGASKRTGRIRRFGLRSMGR